MPVLLTRYELLERRLGRFTRMLHGLDDSDIRALHRTRVASRRLRELLPVLQLQGKVTAELARRLQKITQRLGKIRELDVLLLLIESLRATGRHDVESLALVSTAIARERVEARKRLEARLPLRELRRVGAKLGKIGAAFKSDDQGALLRRAPQRALRWAVDARIERRGEALKSAIEHAGAVYLPERLHAVRIALKKFRYAVELGDEIAADGKLTAPLRLLKRHQDLLGRWHDRQVLIDRVRQVQASLMPPKVAAWRGLDQLVNALENDCRGLHARYVRQGGALAEVCHRLTVRSPAAARRAG